MLKIGIAIIIAFSASPSFAQTDTQYCFQGLTERVCLSHSRYDYDIYREAPLTVKSRLVLEPGESISLTSPASPGTNYRASLDTLLSLLHPQKQFKPLKNRWVELESKMTDSSTESEPYCVGTGTVTTIKEEHIRTFLNTESRQVANFMSTISARIYQGGTCPASGKSSSQIRMRLISLAAFAAREIRINLPERSEPIEK